MRFWNRLFGGKSDSSKRRRPEDYYETEIMDTYVKVTHPKRKDERIDWNEIEEIKLINTDDGPFLSDVWLILIGNGKGCSIPQGQKVGIKFMILFPNTITLISRM